MSDKKTKRRIKPPEMNPYVFTVLLMFFGIWCFYDGFLTTDPEMLEHMWFNRILSMVLIPWAIYDFFKLRKQGRKPSEKTDSGKSPSNETT